MDYKQKIIEEAALMFRTYGIRAVTMDMLASQMNISKRTIYEVFKDKDELLDGVLSWMLVKQKEKTEEVVKESENVIEAIFSIIGIMMDHMQKVSPAFLLDLRRIHKAALEKAERDNSIPYMSNNSEILKKGIEQGLFREDIDVELTNKCMLEVAKISSDKDVFHPDDFPALEVVRNFYFNYLRGISTPKGLDLIEKYESLYSGKQKNQL